jgi:virginiamycin B lyase
VALPAERTPYTNLNTAAFDGRGRIWFTGQNGIYGRLNPTTGDMEVWDGRHHRPRPLQPVVPAVP